MRIGISGTYSSGKTFTSMALSHYTGLPRTKARTMREILPEAAPGKTLEECTAAELIQMIVTRHVERAVYEDKLSDGFISDGSSLQEWIYGSVRVSLGLNPSASAHLAVGGERGEDSGTRILRRGDDQPGQQLQEARQELLRCVRAPEERASALC
ncbi:hypothetical protein ACTAQJ_20580 [Arthrobacter sp. alpha11c]